MKHSELHIAADNSASLTLFDSLYSQLVVAIDDHDLNADHIVAQLDKETALRSIDCERLVSFYKNRSIYFQTIKSNYTKAIQSCDLGLALTQGESEECCNFKISFNKFKGINYYLLGQFETSLDHYFQAIEFINASSYDNELEKAAIFNNISIVFNKKEDSKIRKYYVNKALEIYDRKNSDAGRMKGYINLGNIATKESNFREAVSYNLKAKRINDRVKDKAFAGSIYNNLGCNYLELNELAKAEEYILKSIKIKEKHPDLHSRIIGEISLAELYIKKGEGINAIKLLEHWVDEAQDTGILVELVQIYKFLSEAYALENQHEKAYEYLCLHVEVDKQLLNSEKQRNLVEANEKFRTQLTESEAKFYKKKEKELQKYARKLEETNRELSIFAQLSAHDLKEPVRMMKINLDFLKQSTKGHLSSEQNQMLEFAVKNSNRLATSVNDILKLTKVDNSPPVFEKVNIKEIVNELEAHLQPIIFQKNVQLLCKELPNVLGDYSQFQMLFETLISHSIKYNDSAKPKIEISYLEQEKFHHFFVEDNGQGFPQEFIDEAFNMFSKPTQIKNNNEGTGIALAICKRVVERYKGSIIISNKDHGGSIVSFTIEKKS